MQLQLWKERLAIKKNPPWIIYTHFNTAIIMTKQNESVNNKLTSLST